MRQDTQLLGGAETKFESWGKYQYLKQIHKLLDKYCVMVMTTEIALIFCGCCVAVGTILFWQDGNGKLVTVSSTLLAYDEIHVHRRGVFCMKR